MADSAGKIVREAGVDLLEIWVDQFDAVLVEFGMDNPRAAVAASTLVVDSAREFIVAQRAMGDG